MLECSADIVKYGVWLMSGKIKIAVIVFAVLIVSGVVSFISVVAAAGKSDIIFPGVTVKGIHLGNKTREEAGSALSGYEDFLKNKTITVKFDGGAGQFRLADVDLQVNVNSVLEKALSVGRRGNMLEQWRERRNVAKNGTELPVEVSFDKNKLKSLLDNLTKMVRVPPQDAKIIITPSGAVEILESSTGKGIDTESALAQVKNIINENDNPEIELQTISLKPDVTTDYLTNLRVNGEIASFTTSFDINKTNRVFNIRVAAAALDGQMIKPGEVFSFNEVVGPRSQEAGYKLAPAILNNEFIDSLGGGVCQVSTTLYNALLQADVDIIQRSNHSLTIRYVPLGQDAAVAYGGKDLKFKNNLPCAVIIKSSVVGNKVTLKLYGDVALKKTVRIVNNIIKEYPFQIVYKDDATLPKGTQRVEQKGAKGFRVTSQMMIYQNGQLIGQKKLSASHYAPMDEIVLVGTKPVAAKPTGGNGGNGNAGPGDAQQPSTPAAGPDDSAPETPSKPPSTTTPPAQPTTPPDTPVAGTPSTEIPSGTPQPGSEIL